jgi:hypothetical protein
MFILPGVDNGSKSRATSKVQPVATLPKSSGFFSFLPLLWVFTIFFITISIALQYQRIRIGLNPVIAVENIKISLAEPVEATGWKQTKDSSTFLRVRNYDMFKSKAYKTVSEMAWLKMFFLFQTEKI